MNSEKWYLYDPETEEKIELSFEKEFVVGRAKSNDLPISDQSISSRHAKILLKEKNLWIVDLNSFNSTYLNGKEIEGEKEYKLKPRDVIQFGDKVYYFSSTEANQAFLDLPSLTGSFNLTINDTQDVVLHNYDEPVINLESKKKTFSLKGLRKQKEELDTLKQQLKEAENGVKNREKTRKKAGIKAKELEEFNSYLKAKNYQSESAVKATMDSILEVNERLERDKDKIGLEIKKLEEQILAIKNEIKELDKTEETNKAIMSELKNDIEIIKGRDSLEEELSVLYRKIRSWEKEDITQQITMIKVLIEEKEVEFKKVQKEYADSRFGDNSKLFGGKKVG